VKKATVTFKVKRVNAKWAMNDGAKLAVSVFSPVPKKIGQKFPVVIFIHPWLVDKTMYDTLAAQDASRGYYESYDTRTGTRLSTDEKPIEMTACYHKVKAGSRLRLDIDAADLLTTLPVMQLSLIDLFHDATGASLLILPMAPG